MCAMLELGTLNWRREGDGLVHALCLAKVRNERALNGVAEHCSVRALQASSYELLSMAASVLVHVHALRLPACKASAARVCLGSSSLVNSTMNLRAGRRLEQFGGFIVDRALIRRRFIFFLVFVLVLWRSVWYSF